MGYQDVKFDSLTVRGHLDEAKEQTSTLERKIRYSKSKRGREGWKTIIDTEEFETRLGRIENHINAAQKLLLKMVDVDGQ